MNHRSVNRDKRRMDATPSVGDMTSDSTLDVLERARLGDYSAARVLNERALPTVRQWARGRMPSWTRGAGDTEDLVQDAVVRTLGRLRTFNHHTVGALQAYLRGAVVNHIRDLIRRTRVRGQSLALTDELPAMGPSPVESAILQERIADFLEALQRLRPSDRQLIVWRIELGYSVEEIAQRLGKSKAAASMSVSRALARLQHHMGPKAR